MDSISRNPYFWLCYFTIAAILGYWNYRKGHNFAIGMFISLLLTPITGLLFNIFGKKNTAELKRRAKNNSVVAVNMTNCPSCNGTIPLDAKRCKHCGKKLLPNSR